MNTYSPQQNLNLQRKTRSHTHSPDWWLVAIVTVLVVLGLAFLASSLTSPKNVDNYLTQILKQLFIGVLGGSVLATIASQINYHWLLAKAHWGMWLSFFLLGYLGSFALYANLAAWFSGVASTAEFQLEIIQQVNFLPLAPYVENGAMRWLGIGPLPTFQPAEFTKLATLLFLAKFLYTEHRQSLSLWQLKRPLYGLLASVFLILLQPDFGTVAIIFSTAMAAMWNSPVSRKFLYALLILATILGSILIFSSGYRRERVFSDTSDQVQYAQQAIANGGWFGQGYSQSEFKQQSGKLSEESSDAILAVIAEEMGFIFTIFFISLYFWLLWRGLRIAARAPDSQGRALATGISVWLTVQAFLNITGITGLLPLSGMPLPFVSKGNSAMLINLVAIGVLINISRHTVALPSSQPTSKKPHPKTSVKINKAKAKTSTLSSLF
jgi:cell division protein FtsW